MKLIAFILTVLGLTMPAVAIDVKLSATAHVSDKVITLGEIAEVSGASKEVLGLVRAVHVGEMPTSGETTVTLTEVRKALFAKGFNMAEIDVSGSSRVDVHKAAGRPGVKPLATSRERVRDAIRNLVAAQKGVSEKTIQVEIVEGGSQEVPETAGIRLVCLEPLPESGEMRFEVRPHGEGASFEPFRVKARICAVTAVVVAVRTLPAGTEIGEDDVTLRVFAESSAPTGTLSSIEDAIGSKVSRRVEAGSAIARADLEQQVLVHRGEECTVVVQGKGFHIATKAVAREDGSMGDTVKLEKRTERTRSTAGGDGRPRMRRYTTRERLIGVVTGRRRVEIRAGGEDR